ncbi:hypothetical protein MNBD_GAMMA22-2694 [hydrothermal vent metagenome]|uniref:Uncharacterized protein n=1 Tax=hydrothermal vent metagenome TaxID=652676 RepID=A0A3B0ZQ03_9ZZZZ
MDEDNFRSTYKQLNPERCCFEKSITAKRCSCQYTIKFLLASREGVKCSNSKSKEKCILFLNLLREHARFALKQTKIDGPLPHKKEIKVQVGGLLGLQKASNNSDETNVASIILLLKEAIIRYQSIEQYPYDDIIQSVVNFEIRSKHKLK